MGQWNETVAAITFEVFKDSIAQPDPPAGLAPLLEALWHDGRGNWKRAHEIAQEIESPDAAWVHAYLHRKEGDLSNASYWYRRAGRQVATDSLDAEWEALVGALLR
jgi:hypothetical protein